MGIRLLEGFDPLSMDIGDLKALLMALTLCASRVLTFIITSPFFNSKSLTKIVRTGIVMSMAIVLTPPVFIELQTTPEIQERFFPLVVKELLLGVILGGLVWMPIRGLEFAGVLLDTQRGSTMAQDYNAMSGSPQVTPTGILLSQIFSGFFFASGGMLIVIGIVFQSTLIWLPYESLPDLNTEVAYLYGIFAGKLILSAVIFALPISGFMLLADIGISFIAKGAPTMNAMTFAMPVKSGILLIMLFSYVAIAFPQIVESFTNSLDFLASLLNDE